MEKKSYAVMGASGQVGHCVIKRLLEKGHRVKAIGRDPKKLECFREKGAEIVSITKFDAQDKLNQALKNVDGLFALLPPGYGEDEFSAFQDRVGEAIKVAIQKNSTPHIVNLSSIAAHLSEGTGPIKGLHRQEERLNTLKNSHVLHLRPAYFMENLLNMIPVIQRSGQFQSPLKPELALPMVSTDDIGMKAAEFLDQLNFTGKTIFDFAGPRETPLSMKEIVNILGNAIGAPNLKYIHQSYPEAKQQMLSAGLKPSLVDLLIELNTALNEGKIVFTQKITSEHRGKTTMEKFSEKFAKAFRGEKQTLTA